MRIQTRNLFLSGILSVVILLAGVPAARSQAASEIGNWGRVTDQLYRGSQPASAGFKALQQAGVTIIVNFRDEQSEVAKERREVESLGMRYVSIPWSGSSEPSNSQIAQFLDLVRANPTAKIFVHCKRGADRTGTMIAAYRIAVEHKSVTEAVSEMHQFHYDHFFLPQLERYVESLPQVMLGNSLFSAYALAQLAPSVSAPNQVNNPTVALAAHVPAAVGAPAAAQ